MRLTSQHLFFLPTAFLLVSSGVWGVLAPNSAPSPQSGANVAKQERYGSSVPCAVPLQWRLADIDARFGLGRADADAALRAAFGVWEDQVGRPIFVIDEAGHPISFEYDERQASAQRHRAERRVAAATAQELETRTAQFEDRLALQRRENAALAEAAAAHRGRVGSLNDEVTAWNQRREVPDSVRRRLSAEQAALADEGRDLERWQKAVEEARDSLQAESLRLNREIDEFNRAEGAAGSVAVRQSQAGRYHEQVTTRNGRVEDVRRRIQIFRYDTARDLVIVLAHELGHALGLGHTNVQGAIMSEVNISDESGATPRLHTRDVEMLDATCPALGSSSSGA